MSEQAAIGSHRSNLQSFPRMYVSGIHAVDTTMFSPRSAVTVCAVGKKLRKSAITSGYKFGN